MRAAGRVRARARGGAEGRAWGLWALRLDLVTDGRPGAALRVTKGVVGRGMRSPHGDRMDDLDERPIWRVPAGAAVIVAQFVDIGKRGDPAAVTPRSGGVGYLPAQHKDIMLSRAEGSL